MIEENTPIDSVKPETTANVQQTPVVEPAKAPVEAKPVAPATEAVKAPAPQAPRPAAATPRPVATRPVAARPAGAVAARPRTVGVAPKANYAAKKPVTSAPTQTVVKNDENPSIISVAINALAAAVAVAIAVMIALDL